MGLGNIRYASMKVNQVRFKREEWALGSESDTFTGEGPQPWPFDHCPPLLLDLKVPTQSLSCQCVRSCCDGPRGSGLGILSVGGTPVWNSPFPLGHLNSSFPCLDKDSPSLIEMLDNQKVEFLACGGSHTALLTKVRYPCLSDCNSRRALRSGESTRTWRCGQLAFPREERSPLPTCRTVLITGGLCFDGDFTDFSLTPLHQWVFTSVSYFSRSDSLESDMKFPFFRVGWCLLLVLESMGNSVTIQHRMS